MVILRKIIVKAILLTSSGFCAQPVHLNAADFSEKLENMALEMSNATNEHRQKVAFGMQQIIDETMQGIEETEVNLGGFSSYLYSSKEASKYLLIWLHGGNHECSFKIHRISESREKVLADRHNNISWTLWPIIKALTDFEISVLVMTYQNPAQIKQDLISQIDKAKDLRDSKRFERVLLLAHSFGGRVLLQMLTNARGAAALQSLCNAGVVLYSPGGSTPLDNPWAIAVEHLSQKGMRNFVLNNGNWNDIEVVPHTQDEHLANDAAPERIEKNNEAYFHIEFPFYTMTHPQDEGFERLAQDLHFATAYFTNAIYYILGTGDTVTLPSQLGILFNQIFACYPSHLVKMFKFRLSPHSIHRVTRLTCLDEAENEVYREQLKRNFWVFANLLYKILKNNSEQKEEPQDESELIEIETKIQKEQQEIEEQNREQFSTLVQNCLLCNEG